jgi:hypothetical protein
MVPTPCHRLGNSPDFPAGFRDASGRYRGSGTKIRPLGYARKPCRISGMSRVGCSRLHHTSDRNTLPSSKASSIHVRAHGVHHSKSVPLDHRSWKQLTGFVVFVAVVLTIDGPSNDCVPQNLRHNGGIFDIDGTRAGRDAKIHNATFILRETLKMCF